MQAGKTALAAAVVVIAALIRVPAAPAVESGSFGAPIIEKSIRVQDPQPVRDSQKGARFVSPKSYTETLKFYRKLWKGNENIEFRKTASLPNVRAVHVINKDTRSEWEGMNIYEAKGETRIFVLPRLKPQERK